VRALIAWIPMLEGDERADLPSLIAELADERIHWFHDPQRLAGSAIARTLGAPGHVAWDTYLVYDKRARWEQSLPPPHAWMHQLSEPWADPARQRLDEALERELAIAVRAALND